MKKLALLLILVSLQANAERELLFKRESTKSVDKTPLASKRSKRKKRTSSNLPFEMRPKGYFKSTESAVIHPGKSKNTSFNLLPGRTLVAKISHSVLALPKLKSNIVATILSGPMKGARVIGEASLEKASKRALFSFRTLTHGRSVYEIKATGLSSEGLSGFGGVYHSRETEYFTADFLSSVASGYLDALIPRHTDAFGRSEYDTTPDSALKKGLSTGAKASSERFREKLMDSEEFLEIKGPILVKILILDVGKRRL